MQWGISLNLWGNLWLLYQANYKKLSAFNALGQK
jgi:hypothetical protein